MRTSFFISPDAAPAIGDIREADAACTIYLKPGATQRADWPRYADGIISAIAKGANVVHLGRSANES